MLSRTTSCPGRKCCDLTSSRNDVAEVGIAAVGKRRRNANQNRVGLLSRRMSEVGLKVSFLMQSAIHCESI